MHSHLKLPHSSSIALITRFQTSLKTPCLRPNLKTHLSLLRTLTAQFLTQTVRLTKKYSSTLLRKSQSHLYSSQTTLASLRSQGMLKSATFYCIRCQKSWKNLSIRPMCLAIYRAVQARELWTCLKYQIMKKFHSWCLKILCPVGNLYRLTTRRKERSWNEVRLRWQ